MRNVLILALTTFAVAACASSQANAGWRLNPALCPDLREDVRDRAVTRGVRDLREDRRDERVVNCPRSAFVYTDARGRALRNPPVLPRAYGRVYLGPRGAYYTVYGGRRRSLAVIRL
ncbi:hypothetical protein HK107_08555 [Parvularcula sp. ZS-1/3]|uniref:Secreted protein n=1 Tax=Parvularcula mediterranea TaxID=2732508 RepID=A0A7Y3RLN0_9PROT|nr:hypothetical protein [Parvularcula mediterranea]NNU16368.1 hypothetical protein [Parvularcula mediterranea]